MAKQYRQLIEKTHKFPQITFTFVNRDWLLALSDFLMGIGVASVEIQEDFPVLKAILSPFKDPENILQAMNSFCRHLAIPIPEIALEQLENRNWTAVFREHFTPFAMNRETFIVPSWLKEQYGETLDGKQVIIVEPGQAFGTGLHASTALAADMVTGYGKAHPGFTMIDAGTGTGILSIIAEKNGADKILAFDIDPLCSMALATHMFLNQSEPAKFLLFVGTETALRQDMKVNLVVINIIETIIRKILPSLATMATDQLILSGILNRDSEPFARFINEHGFSIVKQKVQDGWVAFRCEKT
ncbi:MAG: hypothetical protein GXO70_01275 [Acidobacteria bacterium]|nr:hypothetical protein [Acidobacteriota bacterium]